MRLRLRLLTAAAAAVISGFEPQQSVIQGRFLTHGDPSEGGEKQSASRFEENH